MILTGILGPAGGRWQLALELITDEVSPHWLETEQNSQF
jgi:hypothetical protein